MHINTRTNGKGQCGWSNFGSQRNDAKPKTGTVTKNIEEAIKTIKAGQIEFKTDKAGIVHASVGKASSQMLIWKRILVFFYELQKKKPTSSKGIFIKKFLLTQLWSGLAS